MEDFGNKKPKIESNNPVSPYTGYELTSEDVSALEKYYDGLDTADLVEEIEATRNNLNQLLSENTADSVFKLLRNRSMGGDENGDLGLTKDDYINYLSFSLRKAEDVLNKRLH